MKNHTILLALCLMTLPLPALHADEETDRAALRAIKAAYEEAVNGRTPLKIAPYLDENVTGVMVTGDPVRGLPGLEAYWRKVQDLIGAEGTYQVKVNTEKTDIFGDIAVSYGTTDETVRLAEGKEFKFNTLWNTVCRRENGEWKVIRMQATMDPVSNAFVSAKLNSAKFTFAGAGLAVGIVLGLSVNLLRRPRI
jgi:ketosteroid isomerase-like protein